MKKLIFSKLYFRYERHADKVQNQNKLSNETVQLLNNRTKESTNATEKLVVQ